MKQKISAYNIVILGAILIFGQLHFAFAQNKEGSFPPEKNEYIKQIKHHSATPETYRQLADIYIQEDSLDKAVEIISEAKNRFGKASVPLFNLPLTRIYTQKQNLKDLGNSIEEGLAALKTFPNDSLLAKYLYAKGDWFYYQSNNDSAGKYYKKAAATAIKTGDSILYVDILIDISYLNDYYAHPDSSLDVLLRAMEIAQQIRYDKGLARSLSALGNTYFNMGNNAKALDYYLDALNYAKKIKNIRGIAFVETNIGMVYSEIGEPAKGIIHLNNAIDILKKIKDFHGLISAYNNISLAYSKLHNNKKSHEYFLKSLGLVKKYGTKEELAITYHSYATALNNLKRFEESNRYLDSCIAIGNNTGFIMMLKKSYKLYAMNLLRNRQIERGIDYFNKYDRLKDSIYNNKFRKQLALLESRYKDLEKQKKITELKNKNTRIRIILTAVSVILFLLTSSFILYFFYRKKKRELIRLRLKEAEWKNRQLSSELQLKAKQLTTHALQITQKNEILNDLLLEINHLIEQPREHLKSDLKKLEKQIKRRLSSDKEWETFKIYFEQVNKDFFKKLQSLSKSVTPTEERMAALIKLGLTNKEIASILNITHQSVKNARYRLKRKLGLKPEEDLREFLDNL